jgi:hypothetical protein
MTPLTPAERILLSLGITSPKEIDLEAIAWSRGAVVNFRPLDKCETTIVGSQTRAVITVSNRSIPERQRFSIAHELGHWHHHRGRMLFCGQKDVGNPGNDANNPEQQADRIRLRSDLAQLSASPANFEGQTVDARSRARVAGGVPDQPHRDASKTR